MVRLSINLLTTEPKASGVLEMRSACFGRLVLRKRKENSKADCKKVENNKTRRCGKLALH